MGTYENLLALNEKAVVRKTPLSLGAKEDKEAIRQEYAALIGVPVEEVLFDGVFFYHPSTAIMKYVPKQPRQTVGKLTCNRHRYKFVWTDAGGWTVKESHPLKNIVANKAADGTVHVYEKGYTTPFAIYKEVMTDGEETHV